MHEVTRNQGLTWAAIEAIPPTKPSLYIVHHLGLVDYCESIVNCIFGDGHKIKVICVDPSIDGSQRLRGKKELLFFDHSFWYQVDDAEEEDFKSHGGYKAGLKEIYHDTE